MSVDGNRSRPQSGRERTAKEADAAPTKHGDGYDVLAAGSELVVTAVDDDSCGGDGIGDSPRVGHHHQPVTPSASCQSTPFRHNPSVGSTDTEMTSLDTRELWLPDTEPTPSTMSALHQFGAEMLRLSRGLEKVATPESKPTSPDRSVMKFFNL